MLYQNLHADMGTHSLHLHRSMVLHDAFKPDRDKNSAEHHVSQVCALSQNNAKSENLTNIYLRS